MLVTEGINYSNLPATDDFCRIKHLRAFLRFVSQYMGFQLKRSGLAEISHFELVARDLCRAGSSAQEIRAGI